MNIVENYIFIKHNLLFKINNILNNTYICTINLNYKNKLKMKIGDIICILKEKNLYKKIGIIKNFEGFNKIILEIIDDNTIYFKNKNKLFFRQ